VKIERRMKRRLVTIQANESVERAQTLMATYGIRHLPVLDGTRLVGVISDRDLRAVMIPLRSRARARRPILALPAAVRVAEAMTPDPVVIPRSADIEQAARLMVERKIGCLPVVERGRLAGIVTEADVLRVFLEIMGVLAESSRIDVVLGSGGHALERATRVIREAGGTVISVGMSPARRGIPRVHHVRLRKCETRPIAAALRKAGFRVLDRMG
jgi:acetoin utilization protein AcuB